MSGLYWDERSTRLKTYSATTKSSGETVFKIEVSTSDPHEVSYILRQLAETTAKQKADAARQKPRGRACQPDALESPVLQLTYRSDDR